MVNTKPQVADVRVGNQGTVWTFNVQSEEALAWVKKNVQIEGWQGDAAYFVADHRPARDLVEALKGHGFVVRPA